MSFGGYNIVCIHNGLGLLLNTNEGSMYSLVHINNWSFYSWFCPLNFYTYLLEIVNELSLESFQTSRILNKDLSLYKSICPLK